MIFLNPTILFGLLAASIPVVLHFLNLRKIKKIEFSTLTFLKELQKSKIRRVKFKQWLLLILRILIIIFLVSSFARPTLETFTINGTGSTVKTTSVFILDDSYSMSIISENGSYFNKSKEIILDIISNFHEGTDIHILLTSDPNNLIISKNLNLLQKEIRGIKISSITNSLTEAMMSASQIINESLNFNKEVYIFSDFQKSTYSIEQITRKENSALFDEKTKLYLFRYGNGEIKNIALSGLKSENQIFELGKEISFQASVTNFSKKIFNNALLSIFLNGEIMAHQNISINSGETEKTIFATTLRENGIVEILAELEDDEIKFDNQYYSTIRIPEKINMLISSNEGDSKYIDLVLQSSENNFKIDRIKNREINSVELNSYDCIFMIGMDEKINMIRLEQFVRDGGQTIIFPSSNGNSETLNLFLNALNIPQFRNLQTFVIEDQFNEFEEIDFHHLIFNNLFKEESNKKIESPHIKKFYKTTSNDSGEKIISLVDGSSFLTEYLVEKGRIFLFNLSPTLTWSDFPIKSIFAPIINRTVYYLTTKKDNNKALLAGDKIEIDVSKINVPQIKIIRPDKNIEFINLEKKLKYLKYENSNLTGIYKFYAGEKLIDAAAINFNIIESKLESITESEFEDYIKKFGFNGITIGMDNKNYKDQISQARFGSELWKLFLIIALLIALIEMYIASSSKKELAEINY